MAPKRATDDDDSTRWATDSGQQPAWLEVDLGEPQSIGRVFIDEPAEYAASSRSLSCNTSTARVGRPFMPARRLARNGRRWLTPVTASRVRLNILSRATVRRFGSFSFMVHPVQSLPRVAN